MDLTQHTPKRARPALVGLLAGGRQDFPADPIADAYRHRIEVARAQAEGRRRFRRVG